MSPEEMTIAFERASGTSPFAGRSAASDTPFCTEAYAVAMQSMGRDVWLVCAGADVAAIATVERGRVGGALEFPSLPLLAESPAFWDRTYGFCRQAGVTTLVAASFDSPELNLPPLKGESGRRTRTEYVLALDEAPKFSTNHKRNIKKAPAAELRIRRSSSHNAEAALVDHARLRELSMDRRQSRGENVPAGTAGTEQATLVQSRAGELFQLLHEDRVVSSILVLRSAASAYYHSAGTSPDGMSFGASHYLIASVRAQLAEEGCRRFNLGGAPDESSLARFKAGFGAARIVLPSASCYLGSPYQRALGRIASGSVALLRALIRPTGKAA